MFDQLYDIPKERKTGEYRKYLMCIIEYLLWFVQRIKPLMNLDTILDEEANNALMQWELGNCPGWPVSKYIVQYCIKKNKLIYRKKLDQL